QMNYARATKHGDINAPGYKADDYYIAVGADYNVAPDFVVGLGGAYVKHDLDFRSFPGAGQIRADGFQLGVYTAFDPGQYYLKGALSYSKLKGTSTRTVSIGTTAGMITGKPDATIWSISGELGYRLQLGASSVLTPYVGVDYTGSKLHG